MQRLKIICPARASAQAWPRSPTVPAARGSPPSSRCTRTTTTPTTTRKSISFPPKIERGKQLVQRPYGSRLSNWPAAAASASAPASTPLPTVSSFGSKPTKASSKIYSGRNAETLTRCFAEKERGVNWIPTIFRRNIRREFLPFWPKMD